MTGGADQAWADVLGGLCVAHPAAAGPVIALAARLRAAGGVPFEVIAGVPAQRYGTRVTWRPRDAAAAEALAAAAGLERHPWGVPDWIGLRTDADGTVRCKAYHRAPTGLAITTVHRGLAPGVEPVMAALDGDAIEVYATAPGQQRWSAFVERALGGFATVPEPIGFAPEPMPHARGFGMSARHVHDDLVAVSLFAFAPSLRRDEQIASAWSAGIGGQDLLAYSAAVTAIGALGRPVARTHGLLAWTFEGSGATGRAVSLRVPPLAARFRAVD